MKPKQTKVIVIGSTGLIGSAVVRQLEAAGYDVLGVTRRTSPTIDLTDVSTIDLLFEEVEPFEHVIVLAGDARFGDLNTLDDAAIEIGLRSKLMGQVHVVLAAMRHLPRGGSVTLTSGDPSRGVATSDVAALYLQALESDVHGRVLTRADLREEVRDASA